MSAYFSLLKIAHTVLYNHLCFVAVNSFELLKEGKGQAYVNIVQLKSQELKHQHH